MRQQASVGLNITLTKDQLLRKVIEIAIVNRLVSKQANFAGTSLVDRLKLIWKIQHNVATALCSIDSVKGSRLFNCRPWGKWVMFNELPLPYVCDFSICPNCLARDIERIYESLFNNSKNGYTRIWTHTTVVGSNARQQMKAFRDYMSYKLGKIYKIPAYTFVRLINVNGQWVITLNALIPGKIRRPEEIVLASQADMEMHNDYIADTSEAVFRYLPRLMSFQTHVFKISNSAVLQWYLNETSKLHPVRGVYGLTIDSKN